MRAAALVERLRLRCGQREHCTSSEQMDSVRADRFDLLPDTLAPYVSELTIIALLRE
jgi:hypothetical protein